MDIQTSRTTLDYPLYVCEFDPSDPGRLIVGGGGGASRTGVGNKITLLNAARSDDPGLPTTAELELARDEDSVTSLAVGPRRGRATLAFAGINSRVDAQGAAANDHFRVFAVDGATASARSEPKITELARAPFFSTSLSSSSSSSTTTASQPDLDTYQRVVRVSPPFSDGHGSTLPQLGACATGLAKADGHEIVVFDVTSAAPAAAAVKKTANTAAAAAAVLPKVRGRLELPREAVDLDIVQTGTHSYQLAFAHEHALYLFDVDTAGKQAGRPARSSFSTADGDAAAAAAAAGPRCVYTIPLDKDNGATERLTFRALRYVTPGFVLAACNLPRRTGVVLLGLRLPSAGVGAVADQAIADNNDINERRPPANEATIAVNVRLPTAVAQATGLAVRNLAPPTAPGARQADDTQFVVAVAGSGSTRSSNKDGSGISLSLYTLAYRREPAGGLELLTKLYPFRTLRSVHELPMTSLALSAPSAVSSSSSTSTPTSVPYVRLASVSVKNTVVVHHIPLRKVPPAGASGRAGKTGKAPPSATTAAPGPHYVVALRSRPPTATALLVASALLLLVLTLLGQALLEMRGLARPWIGVRHVVPAAWQAPLVDWLPPPAGQPAGQPAEPTEDAPLPGTDNTALPTWDDSHNRHDSIDTDAYVAEFLSGLGIPGDSTADTADTPHVLFLRGADADHTIAVLAPHEHDPAAHGPAVGWDALTTGQQAAWRRRLQAAGHWTASMGEAVLRGVLFSEMAGAMGGAVQDE